MYSVIAICNMALGRIGIAREISDLKEESSEARLCSRFYPISRDHTLRAHPWPFATRYHPLAVVGGSDAEAYNEDWQWAYRFPASTVTVRRIVTSQGLAEPEPPPFALGRDDQGRLILTDQAEATAECTALVTDPSHFDPAFVSALAWRLATELAMPLAVHANLRNQAMQMYQLELAHAAAQAANEQRDPEPPDSEFVRGRQ